MRLYGKLLVMILLAGALQHYAPPSAWGGDAWFALRCHMATVMGDEALAAQMVEEHYQAVHCPAREMQLNLEIELTLAAG